MDGEAEYVGLEEGMRDLRSVGVMDGDVDGGSVGFCVFGSNSILGLAVPS